MYAQSNWQRIARSMIVCEFCGLFDIGRWSGNCLFGLSFGNGRFRFRRMNDLWIFGHSTLIQLGSCRLREANLVEFRVFRARPYRRLSLFVGRVGLGLFVFRSFLVVRFYKGRQAFSLFSHGDLHGLSGALKMHHINRFTSFRKKLLPGQVRNHPFLLGGKGDGVIDAPLEGFG